MMVKLYNREKGRSIEVEDAVDVINSESMDGIVVVDKDGERTSYDEDIIFAARGAKYDVWIEPRNPQIDMLPWKGVGDITVHPGDVVVAFGTDYENQRKSAGGTIRRVAVS